jgi:hypothetical protein
LGNGVIWNHAFGFLSITRTTAAITAEWLNSFEIRMALGDR